MPVVDNFNHGHYSINQESSMGRDKINKDDNLMELVPERAIDNEITEDGKIVLLIPKFKGLIGKIILPRMKSPYFRLNLDEFGSFVWNHCDGDSNVFQISESIRAEFGEAVEPKEKRLAMFIQKLYQAKALNLRKVK